MLPIFILLFTCRASDKKTKNIENREQVCRSNINQIAFSTKRISSHQKVMYSRHDIAESTLNNNYLLIKWKTLDVILFGKKVKKK